MRPARRQHDSQRGCLKPAAAGRHHIAVGNAGILRELLRYTRASTGGPTDYAVPWPDHPAPREQPRTS
jgi:hypothetical protein